VQPPAVRLLIVRHGEAAANREMRYLGAGDPPLTAHGRNQAAGLAAALAGLRVGAVLSSPLRRARETAAAISQATGWPVVVEPRLIEMSFGEWEGLTREEVAARGAPWTTQLELWERDPRRAPPGGESLASVRERCLDLVRDLAAGRPTRPVVAVTHVGPLKALLCAALGLPLAASRRMFVDPATVTVVDWGRRPVLRLFNAPAATDLASARWASGTGSRRPAE
jgi:probable phosphoglycerate mutase